MTGGTPSQVTTPSPSSGEISHEWPALSPSGRCLIYVTNAQTRTLNDSHLTALDLTSGTTTRILANAVRPQFGPDGELFFMFRDGEIGVSMLTADCRSLTSQPVGLGPHPWLVTGAAFYAIGPHGELAYVQGPDLSRRSVTMTDGKSSTDLPGTRSFHSIAVAPDGRTIAATTIDRTLLVTTLDRTAWTVAAKDIALTPPLWAPDGNHLVISPRAGTLAAVGTAGTPSEVLVEDSMGRMLYPLTWGPDGKPWWRRLGVNGLWQGAPAERATTFVSDVPVAHVEVDPLGQLVAFASDYSGRYEVYVPQIGSGEPTIQASSGAGAMEPHWSRDGRRLYFSSGAAAIHAVDVTRAPLRVSSPTPVPGILDKTVPVGERFTFAVLPDSRILYVREPSSSSRHYFHVRQHWQSLLPAGAGLPWQ